ncbi:unnamed protein product [Arctogadus glacialis]
MDVSSLNSDTVDCARNSKGSLRCSGEKRPRSVSHAGPQRCQVLRGKSAEKEGKSPPLAPHGTTVSGRQRGVQRVEDGTG